MRKMVVYWVMENPHGALRKQLYMHCMRSNMRIVDYCKYDHPIQKRSNFWTNMPWKPRLLCQKDCRYLQENHTRRHQLTIGGKHTLTHQMKNKIPLLLLDELLRCAIAHVDMSARKTPWVLDLFSGYQSLREVVESHGLVYRSVDIEPYFGKDKQICTDLPVDFMDHTIPSVIEALGMEADDLVLIWLSPPCQTFSKLDQVNRRHRDHSSKHKQAVSKTAVSHDALVMHTINCIADFC